MRTAMPKGPSKGEGNAQLEIEETCFLCSAKEELSPRTVGLHDIMACKVHAGTVDRCCDELVNGLRYVVGKPPMKKEEPWNF